MHSNRKVLYKGCFLTIRNISKLQPKWRQMARTIAIIWHGIPPYLTAERRINRRREESIVYLCATYRVKPSQHVVDYRKRWPIEKFFRTAKQHLGLQECYSRKLIIKRNHIASVFLAYALLEIVRKSLKLKTPEEAIRRLKSQKVSLAESRICRLVKNFEIAYA